MLVVVPLRERIKVDKIEAVNSDYFKEEILIITGRALQKKDNDELRAVTVVSDNFVDKYLKGQYTYDEVLGNL